MTAPFNTPVTGATGNSVLNKTEVEINEEFDKVDERNAKAKLENAKAEDQIALTKLKGEYAAAIMFFLWFWFGALCLATLTYFSSQLTLNKEIPKEVILGMFTTTAVVVGLVGYILKGLFGNGNK